MGFLTAAGLVQLSSIPFWESFRSRDSVPCALARYMPPLQIMHAAQKLGGEEEKMSVTVVLEDFLRAVFLLGAAATVMSQDPLLFSPRVFPLARAGAILVKAGYRFVTEG